MKRVSTIYLLAGLMAITSVAVPLTSVAKQPETSGQYTLYSPALTEKQQTEIQSNIDAQMLRRTGGLQISSTQIAYDNGNAVITFPVPGTSDTPNTTCDFGYVCFWEHNNYQGKKLALISTPTKRTENLAQYDMSHKISSWKHTNNIFYVAIGGASQENLGGKMVMSNTWERDIGGDCCPFGIDNQTNKAPPPEFIFKSSLAHDNAMASVGFYPYPQ
jgi:hypothetical protein